MIVSSHKKIVWIVKVDCYTGDVLDIRIKRIPKTLGIGNTGNGDGTCDVTLYPSRDEYKQFYFDKIAVMNYIKDSSHYKQEILRSIFTYTLNFYKFFQKYDKKPENK